MRLDFSKAIRAVPFTPAPPSVPSEREGAQC